MVNDLIKHAYVTKPLESQREDLESFGKMQRFLEGGVYQKRHGRFTHLTAGLHLCLSPFGVHQFPL
jgi:hypothetical protein